jgi:hypothetical protein
MRVVVWRDRKVWGAESRMPDGKRGDEIGTDTVDSRLNITCMSGSWIQRDGLFLSDLSCSAQSHGST